jgi:uncharacterized protein (TIGR03382 family)
MFRAIPLLLLPLAALGQTSVTQPFVIQVSGVSDVNLYPETCSQTLTGKWFSQVTATACDPMKLWATTGECQDAPGTNDVRFNDVPVLSLGAGSGEFSVKVSTLPGFKDAATPCGGSPFELTHKVCGALSTASGLDCTFSTSRSIVRATPANLYYDTQPPSTPTLDGITELDKALQIYFTATDDVVAIEVWIRAEGEADWTYVGDSTATTGSAVIQDLVNGTLYEVAIYALDASANASEASNVLTGTPRLTQGFWAAYQAAGGGDKGCGSSATGFGAPLLVLALLALTSRRKR